MNLYPLSRLLRVVALPLFLLLPSLAAAQAPFISGISPSTPHAGPSNQNVTVFGGNFRANLTVTVTWTGGGATLSGTQIQNVTNSSFVMVITLGGPGSYTIRVNNSDGTQSGNFTFTSITPPAPTISSISPSSPTAGPSNQNV